jgi:hypothetical protein
VKRARVAAGREWDQQWIAAAALAEDAVLGVPYRTASLLAVRRLGMDGVQRNSSWFLVSRFSNRQKQRLAVLE